MSDNRWRGQTWFNHELLRIMGKYCDPRTGKGITNGKIDLLTHALAYEIPWAFTPSYINACSLLLDVYWDKFKIIPKVCRERCWKVVVKPQTVHELYQFHKLMNQMHVLEGYDGKCGIDGRWYTSARYAGFFYNTTRKAGQQCCERVRELMQASDYFVEMFRYEEITGKPCIYLKKGCTEMQHPVMGGFRSSTWETHPSIPAWDELESRLDDMFNRTTMDRAGLQPPWLINKIVYSWCEYAHSIGDPTYKDVLGYDPFKFTEDTYHITKGGMKEELDQTVEDLHLNLKESGGNTKWH